MDKQALKLIARIAENLPEVEASTMQSWIDNPKGLQMALKFALICPRFRVCDGDIYFSVTSRKTTGPDWVSMFEKKKKERFFYFDGDTERALLGPDFEVTSGFTTEVVITSNNSLKGPNQMKRILARAKRKGWVAPSPEVACLVVESLTYKEIWAMNLSRITFCGYVTDRDFGIPLHLCLERYKEFEKDDEKLRFEAFTGDFHCFEEHVGNGFAFVVPPGSKEK